MSRITKVNENLNIGGVIQQNSCSALTGSNSVAFGSGTTASGLTSYAEGFQTTAYGNYSHAEGYRTATGGITLSSTTLQVLSSLTFTIYIESNSQDLPPGNFVVLTPFSDTTSNWLNYIGLYGTGGTLNVLLSGGSNPPELYPIIDAALITEGTLIYDGDLTGTTGTTFTSATFYFMVSSGSAITSAITSGHYSHAGGSASTATGVASFIHSTNSIVSGARSVVLGGQNITGNTADTVYVPHLNIKNLTTGTSITSLGVAANGDIVSGTSAGDTYWVSGSSGTFSLKRINNSGLDATGNYSLAEGFNTRATAAAAHAEGSGTTAAGNYSHAEGFRTVVQAGLGIGAHAEGSGSTAVGNASHAEGRGTVAHIDYSHAEGRETLADGSQAHAEGLSTTAQGTSSHSEGETTTAIGDRSHAEGWSTKALGQNSHAEGQSTVTTVNAQSSHAEGRENICDAFGTSIKGQFGIASHAMDDVHSYNRFFHNGGAQEIKNGYVGFTTNGTPKEIGIDFGLSRFTLTGDSAWNFTADIVASQDSGSSGSVGDTATFNIQGTIKNVGGTTQLVGQPIYKDGTGGTPALSFTPVTMNADAAASTWTAAFSANTSTSALTLTVTGEVNKTINWVARVSAVQVGYRTF